MISHEPLRSAIIGCGAIAHEHVRFFAKTADARLVAVVDRSRAIAEFFRDHYGAEAALTDTRELFAAGAVDVVHVLTPPETHEPIVTAALEARCHVICEKPMALSLAGTQQLLDRAGTHDRVLVESNNAIWNENVAELRRLIADGSLGDVREVEVALSLDLAGGAFGDTNLAGEVNLPLGAVHDFLPHLCALYLLLTGATGIDGATGRIGNLSGNARVKYDYLDCQVTSGTQRGVLRILPDVAPSGFRIVVRGTKGSAETDLFNSYLRASGGVNIGKRAPLELIVSGKRMMRSGFRNFADKVAGHTPYHSLDLMLQDVYAAIRRGQRPSNKPEAMLAIASMIETIGAMPKG